MANLGDFKANITCPAVDTEETNKAKQIMQVQQNIACRLESVRMLLVHLQADMQGYSPAAAKDIRGMAADLERPMGIKEQWLLDTRHLISIS